MKTYKHLYEKMLELDNIKECIKKACKNKTKRRDVTEVKENIDKHAKKFRDIVLSGEFTFHKASTAIINESNQRKERLIAKPRFKYDQIMHHVLVSQLRPIVEKGLYEFACGSIPDRGPHYGKKYLEKWIRSYGNRRFYVLKADIEHFYDNIDHHILKFKLQKVIQDSEYLDLLFSLIDSYEPGIAKGYYTSQWLANFYLKEFDHYIKQELKAPHYIRYMDDIVILSPNKRKLHRIKEGIDSYLEKQLNLKLKSNWQVYRFVDRNDEHGRDIDFMGFRFFRNKTILRKSNLRSIRRKANKLGKKTAAYNNNEGKGVTVHDAQSMLSYLGWTKHADVYGYYQKWIKPKVNKRNLRKKVSINQKKLNSLNK